MSYSIKNNQAELRSQYDSGVSKVCDPRNIVEGDVPNTIERTGAFTCIYLPKKYMMTPSEVKLLEELGIIPAKEVNNKKRITLLIPKTWKISRVSASAFVIIDDKGRTILYLNFYFDLGDKEPYDAYIKLIPYYRIEKAVPQKGKVVFAVIDAYGNIVFTTNETNDDWNIYYKHVNKCTDWLDSNFPLWEEPLAYYN